MLEFYIPLWMKKYVFSKTYTGLRFDGKTLNEKTLQKRGIIIKRRNHAIKSMHAALREEFRVYVHLPEERFYRISVIFSCTKKQRTPVTITTGLRMPPAKEWQ